MGTMLQAADLTADDFGGPELEGCNENLVLTRPDVVREIHARLPRGRRRLVETNTFGCAPSCSPSTAWPTGPARSAGVAARAGPRRAPATGASWPARWDPTTRRSRSPAASPSTRSGPATGSRRPALIAGGADVLLLETCRTRATSRRRRSACAGVAEAGVEPAGDGQRDHRADGHDARRPGRRGARVVARALAPFSLGLNCATGPEFMTDHLRTLSALTHALHLRLSQRGPARRARPVRRDADEPGLQAAALPRRGLGQHRGRLLRHHAGAHPRPSPRWPRARGPRVPADGESRSRCPASRCSSSTTTTGRCSSASAPT